MIRGGFFSVSLTSVISRNREYIYLFSIDIPEIQLITSVFRLYHCTEDLVEWLT